MDNRIAKYLQDVLLSIEEIDSFLKDRPKRFSTFYEDTLFRRGVERNIEIIGEAINRALKLDPELKITDARKIVDTRNFVIHAYDSLRPELLWGIVINHLPLLKSEIILLLDGAE